jgi:serine/threonine-protein kinase
MREAQIGASLHLPGVARTLDVLEEPDGRLGIVMDFLEGTPLADIAPGELDAGEVVRIVADLLATIGRIHAQGIVRLDIKPDNIMLNADRQPIVLDLGLARPIYEKASIEVTGVSTLVGTPAFMAPEQITGATIDGRTDVYSAACVLFQLLGGDLAPESNAISLLARRVNEPHLPIAELQCSDELRGFIATATARSPDDRFTDADSARAALLTVPEAVRLAPEGASEGTNP